MSPATRSRLRDLNTKKPRRRTAPTPVADCIAPMALDLCVLVAFAYLMLVNLWVV